MSESTKGDKELADLLDGPLTEAILLAKEEIMKRPDYHGPMAYIHPDGWTIKIPSNMPWFEGE